MEYSGISLPKDNNIFLSVAHTPDEELSLVLGNELCTDTQNHICRL